MPVISILNEDELLSKAAGGDHHAFRILYDRYYNKIYAFTLHLLKTDQLAEDVTQETFLKLWKEGYALTQIRNLEGFLVTIARNRSLDLLRRTKLQVRTDLYHATNWKDVHNDTEESIILNDAKRVLEKAIDRLPPQQKLVYQLCHQDGLKYEEAAVKLNLSVLTVQSYMKLALRSVRKYMADHTDIAIFFIILKLF